MKKLTLSALAFVLLMALASGCASASTLVLPTSTPIPPTSTPIPSTATSIPPTATLILPTATVLAIPTGFPKYIPIYPNAKIVRLLSEDVIEFVTSDTFEQVTAFYQNSLPPLGDEGWEDGIMGGQPGLLVQCSASKCDALAVLKKGNQEIQVIISENVDKSVRITLGYIET